MDNYVDIKNLLVMFYAVRMLKCKKVIEKKKRKKYPQVLFSRGLSNSFASCALLVSDRHSLT